MILKDKISGCLFGMAIGDGFGRETEFMNIAEIIDKWPPNGPGLPEGDPILVTDDTQMALAVGESLIESAKESYNAHTFGQVLIHKFITWYNDPRNNRAPGMTCLRACENLEKGIPWEKATYKDSKGCGANMRVVPVGLLTALNLNYAHVSALAQFQSAITHAHPTALVASDITAITVSFILNGVKAEKLLSELLNYANAQKGIYHEAYLNTIWDRPPFNSPKEFIDSGWEEIIDRLDKVQIGLLHPDSSINPCLIGGEGWIAEESFATALYCFLLFPNHPMKAMQRAVVSSGDSDSIACLTGAFVGAYCGISAIPSDLVKRIEYRENLEKLVQYYLK